jgi:hypothetical protein
VNTLQCPRCALRFRHAGELRDHLGREHPRFRAEATTAEDDLLEACHCHHGGHAPLPARSGHLDSAA